MQTITPTKEESRQLFEDWAAKLPYELNVDRFDEDAQTWPGQYCEYNTQLAWEAWMAAQLSEIKSIDDFMRDLTEDAIMWRAGKRWYGILKGAENDSNKK